LGWGIDFKADIYLSRQDYGSNPSQVQDAIDDLSEGIEQNESRLKMFASSNVRDIVPEEWKDQPLDWINAEINSIVGSLKEDIVHRYQLELYKESLNA